MKYSVFYGEKFGYQIAGLIFVCMALMLLPGSAFAANFGAMAKTVGGQSNAIASAVKSIALLIGFGFIVAAIVMFAGMKKNQTPPGIPIVMLIAGILLVSITAFVGMGSESLFGSSSTNLKDIGITIP